MGHVPKPPVLVPDGGHVHGAHGVNRAPDQPRAGRILGAVVHTSDGTFAGNHDCFVDQQDTWGGLTDYQVGGAGDGSMDGVIEEFVDPSDVLVPYANGGWRKGPNPPTPQAVDFVRTYAQDDIEAINARLRSVEHPDNGDNDFPISPRQWDASALLLAWIHAEQAGQTAETFAWHFGHADFGVQHTDCPGLRFKRRWDEFAAWVKAVMHAYQTNTPLPRPLLITYPPGWAGGAVLQPGAQPGGPTPLPPPPPDTTVHYGLAADGTPDDATLARWFGTFRAYNAGGPVSRVWRAYGLASGLWPALLGVTAVTGGNEYRFDGGLLVHVDAATKQAGVVRRAP